MPTSGNLGSGPRKSHQEAEFRPRRPSMNLMSSMLGQGIAGARQAHGPQQRDLPAPDYKLQAPVLPPTAWNRARSCLFQCIGKCLVTAFQNEQLQGWCGSSIKPSPRTRGRSAKKKKNLGSGAAPTWLKRFWELGIRRWRCCLCLILGTCGVFAGVSRTFSLCFGVVALSIRVRTSWTQRYIR